MEKTEAQPGCDKKKVKAKAQIYRSVQDKPKRTNKARSVMVPENSSGHGPEGGKNQGFTSSPFVFKQEEGTATKTFKPRDRPETQLSVLGWQPSDRPQIPQCGRNPVLNKTHDYFSKSESRVRGGVSALHLDTGVGAVTSPVTGGRGQGRAAGRACGCGAVRALCRHSGTAATRGPSPGQGPHSPGSYLR